jgi:tape measure domain-containing protein
MSEFIEILSPSALKDLQTANAEIVTMISNVDKVGTKMKGIATPSGSDSAIKSLTEQYKAQEKVIIGLQNQIGKLIEKQNNQKGSISGLTALEKERIRVQKELDRTQAKITSSTDQNTIALNSQKSVLKSVAGSYAELSEKVKRASDNYQNIIVRGKTAEQTQRQYNKELKEAKNRFQELQSEVLKADKAVGKWNRTNERSVGFVKDLAYALGWTGLLFMLKDLAFYTFGVTKQMESQNLALRNVTGSAYEFLRAQRFLREIAQDYGGDIQTLNKLYSQFYVNAKGKLERPEIEKVFASISKSAGFMGLSVQQQERAFLALNQMMSKGTVQAEELRGQLAEALPGAVQAMTRAYQKLHPELKVTEASFLKLMKDGKILSAEILPGMVVELEKMYGILDKKSVDTLTASLTRAKNAFIELIDVISQTEAGGAVADFFNIVLEGWTSKLNAFSDALKSEAQLRREYLQNIGQTAEEEMRIVKASKGTMLEQEKFSNEKLKELYEKREKLQTDALLVQRSKTDKSNKTLREFIRLSEEQTGKKYSGQTQNEYIIKANELIAEQDGFIRALLKTTKELNTENTNGLKNQKDRIDLDYAEIESKYKLRIAKLELLKAQQEEIAENENATDFGRLEARKEFSRLEAEIITANYELETELSKKQFDDNNKEAKKKYEENKKNGYNDVRNNLEFAKAKQDILNKYLNDTVTATENRDKQIFDLMIKDAEFAEKIRKVQFEKEEDHRKKTLEAERELALALNKVEQKKFLKFSEDTKRTVKARQLAFLEYKRLALAQLDLEMTIELAKADPEKYDVIRQKYAELRKAIEEQITPLQKTQQETENWINSFKTKPINDFQKALEDAGLASLKMFTDFDEAGETTFSKMMDYAKNSTEQMKVALLAVSEVGQDVFNLISEASNASFKNEYANLEKQKNISLAFAGENEEARAEVERQAEERRKQIARREFQAKKKQAKANIAIDMAQALIALWVKPGFPAAIPMAAVVAGLGIAQMAMVDAQQMPEFWKGTDNAPEGWALTQEKGRELILDKNNNLKSKGNDKGATKTWLNKGDKVIPHEKTMEYLMFNNELNGMLTNNQISEKQPIVNVNSGMSDAQVDRIVSSIKNKSELHIIKDKFGERSFERKQRQTVEIANARVNFKSSAV